MINVSHKFKDKVIKLLVTFSDECYKTFYNAKDVLNELDLNISDKELNNKGYIHYYYILRAAYGDAIDKEYELFDLFLNDKGLIELLKEYKLNYVVHKVNFNIGFSKVSSSMICLFISKF